MIVLTNEPQDLSHSHFPMASLGADRLDQPLVTPTFQRRFTDADRSRCLLRETTRPSALSISFGPTLTMNDLDEL